MDDLVNEFITETNESLDELDRDIVNLEQNPNDKDLLSKIFRLMHTIKGTCGFLGLPRLETVAHRAENVLGRFRDGDLSVTPAYVTLILESIDRIKFIVGEIEEKGAEPAGDDRDLIAKLDAVYEGRGDTAAAAPATAAPAEDEHGFVPVPAHMTGQIMPPAAAAPTPAPVSAPAPAADTHDDHAAPKTDSAKDGGNAAATLRVNVDVLENLMTMVSELVLNRNQLLQILRSQNESEFSAPLQRLNHVVSDLQDGVMKTRMQPIGNAWQKLPRIIRDLSHELGKKIDLEMRGQDTELDRQVLDLIKDPLTHMVRNSGDHGIEDPATRRAAGKPETGKILLNAFHEGGHIIIEISDDGKGLPVGRIKQKILEKGLANEAEIAAMSPQQIYQFIFKAGFSTAEKVTSVSGRGVGMDVVRTNIEKIGGSIELNSTEGKGSTFTIKIPLTLAIVSALIVEAGGERYAIPQLSVRELVMASPHGENRIETIRETPVFRLRDRLLPLVSLTQVLKLGTETANERGNRYIVVTKVGNQSFGIIVDRVYDTEEIVVKPVSKSLRHIALFAGNTILGDGSVIMILDPNGVANLVGDIAGSADEDAEENARLTSALEKTSLLLFRAGASAPKAVPLSLVARLENISMNDIERSGETMLVQYRGHLMPLMPFSDQVSTRPQDSKDGIKPVLVFTDQARAMGLIVDEIVDITEEHISVEVSGDNPSLLGSAIISGKATDVVDIGHFLQCAHKDWFKTHGDEAFGDERENGARRRVLLVDDSPFFRNMLTPLLGAAGYDVTTLESPKQALKMRESGERFDVIISDIEMPEMNGFEFAEQVKAGGDWQATPMVALTSHATPQDIDRGHAVGFSQYVAKFDRDTLLNALSRTLTTQRRQA